MQKKKISDMDKYVMLSLTVIIMYTIAAVIYQFITGQELSPSLTVGVYGAFSGELLMLCLIKKFKLQSKQ